MRFVKNKIVSFNNCLKKTLHTVWPTIAARRCISYLSYAVFRHPRLKMTRMRVHLSPRQAANSLCGGLAPVNALLAPSSLNP